MQLTRCLAGVAFLVELYAFVRELCYLQSKRGEHGCLEYFARLHVTCSSSLLALFLAFRPDFKDFHY